MDRCEIAALILLDLSTASDTVCFAVILLGRLQNIAVHYSSLSKLNFHPFLCYVIKQCSQYL